MNKRRSVVRGLLATSLLLLLSWGAVLTLLYFALSMLELLFGGAGK